MMRRANLVAELLIVVLLALSPACVSGWFESTGAACSPGTTTACTRNSLAASKLRGSCEHTAKTLPSTCGLRSFVQSQMPESPAVDLFTPAVRQVGIILPRRTTIFICAIGSPETDRGPPLS